MPILLLPFASSAHAADVQFEGFYRGRFRAFDSLSLQRGEDLPLNEGLSALAQHRLWLEPRFLVSDHVSLMVQIKALDGVPWGIQPTDYANYGVVAPNAFEYDLTAPTSQTDERVTLLDITLWRAWGEVYTPIGQFSFGRMPLLWGQGIWQNDGLSVDPLSADYGDTTDRLLWEALIQKQFYLRANIDVPAEGYLGTNDDTTAFGFGLGYKTEDIRAGLQLQLDHTGPEQLDGQVGPDGHALNVFTADAAGDVQLGKLNVAAELVGQFGSGTLPNGLNEANITAIGGVLHGGLDLDAWRLHARTGIATGDNNPTDLNLRAFTFDRDYSVGMFLFEQPMPTLATTAAAANALNGGRDYTQAITGTALSNALFLTPRVERKIVDGLWVDASWLGARMTRGLIVDGVQQRRGYGNEFQLGASYEGIEHFLADMQFGLFLPGTAYSRDAGGQNPTGFESPAFGFQLTGRVDF